MSDQRYEVKIPYLAGTKLEIDILRQVNDVEVVEPAELRGRMAERMGKAAAKYAG